MQQTIAPGPDRVDARAALSTYLIFGGICVPMFVLGILTGRGPYRDLLATVANADPLITGVSGSAFLLSMLWAGTFRLRVADGTLSYRTLFGGTRSILLSDIEKAETQLVSAGRGQVRVLMIYPRPETMQKPMRVNIKVFSREDLGRVFDLLGPRFQGSRRIGVYSNDSA